MASPTHRRPRQADIAKLAGVSQATVSVVLNERTGPALRIPEETRTRVLEAARRLGYVANPVARNLAGGRNRLIGVYTFEPVFPVGHHDFYHPFLVGIEAAAESRGYDLLLFTSATAPDGGRSIYRGNANRLSLADGCVLLGKHTDKDEVARLRDEGFPFTVVGRRDVPGGGITYVSAEYDAATRRVVEHLVALGHRRIAYLPAGTPSEPAADRDSGYWAAHDHHRLRNRDLVRPVGIRGPSRRGIETLLRSGATAVVTHEAEVALRVHDILAQLGLEVPDDCSVAALNDPPDGAAIELTGFRIPRHEMGEHAVDLLVERLEAERPVPPRSVSLPCRFVAGQTGAPVRGTKGPRR